MDPRCRSTLSRTNIPLPCQELTTTTIPSVTSSSSRVETSLQHVQLSLCRTGGAIPSCKVSFSVSARRRLTYRTFVPFFNLRVYSNNLHPLQAHLHSHGAVQTRPHSDPRTPRVLPRPHLPVSRVNPRLALQVRLSVRLHRVGVASFESEPTRSAPLRTVIRQHKRHTRKIYAMHLPPRRGSPTNWASHTKLMIFRSATKNPRLLLPHGNVGKA